ncbi:MAG TPA: DUF4129 domain-containing protein [Ohtaekwangia sp.]|nr:DUF4129 domain-containing protein [Ohtaekwangia sp.]
MRYLIVLLLLFSSLASSLAQDQEPTDEEQTDYDVTEPSAYDYQEEDATSHTLVDPRQLESTARYRSKDIEVKKFDPEKWKKVVGTETYQEKKVPQETQELRTPSRPWNSDILRVIAYIIIIALVLIILYYVSKSITFQQKFRKVNTDGNTDELPVENIAETDLAQLLQQALQAGDFRRAVRLYYLLLLQQLNAREMIEWKKDKTNREYLAELFAKDYHYDEVKTLTLAYERVWYGEYVLEQDSFRTLIARFENFYHQINVPVTP